MATKTKKASAKHSRKASTRKARPGSRKAARRRMDEGEVTTTASPYRDMQREYTTALWL